MSKRNKSSEEKEAANPPAASAVDAVDRPPPPDESLPPETQGQRWLKYGANVVLTTVVVLGLAAAAIWASSGTVAMTQKLHARTDLSSDSSNQLKPQTIGLIKDLPQEVTLVSLYPKLKKEEAAAKGADTYSRVLDILNEYKKNSPKIQVEAIDPTNDPGRLDAWLGELKRKYGKNIENYEKFLKEQAPKAITEIAKLTENEAKALQPIHEQVEARVSQYEQAFNQLRRTVLPLREYVSLLMPVAQQIAQSAVIANAQSQTLGQVEDALSAFPTDLAALNDQATKSLQDKIPDFAAAVRTLRNGSVSLSNQGLQQLGGLDSISRQCTQIEQALNDLATSPISSAELKQYAVAAKPRIEAIKKKVDDTLKIATDLGPLKLDDVRKKLLPDKETDKVPAAIAILGPDDVRVIDDFSLWKSGEATGITGRQGQTPKLRFAGEQQITSAILGLMQPKKQRVVFLNASQQPLTMRRGPFAGQYAEAADRLRGYNFEVDEKNVSQPNARPEPPDPQAILVVPSQASEMQMPMPLSMQLKQHLDAGGSALCLIDVNGDSFADVLKDWGIEVKANAVIVHEPIEAGNANAADFVEEARRRPAIFVLNDFGDHPITTPLRSLDAALVPLVPVLKLPGAKNVTVTSLIPIPQTPPSWGESNLSSAQQIPDEITGKVTPLKFDPSTDVAPPLFAGAAAEKSGKGRLVVLGSANSFTSRMMTIPDEKLANAKPPVIVSRFPANGELFTNSIFWLAKNEKMIALSPSAMDTARIAALPPEKLSFIRIGLVMVILPLLAVAAGMTVWLRRRG